MAKVHKLAAAGAACVQQLPELTARLGALREKLRGPAADRPDLGQTLAAFDEVLGGLQRLSHNISLLPRRRLEPTALVEVVQEALSAVLAESTARQVSVRTEVTPDFVVLAEGHRLSHALAEVLRNAIRHSPESGTVQVRAERRGQQVSVSVVDGGAGFPPEILESACDPFVTRSGEWEALGLGLFEARQIVMSCGGTLEIDSRPGQTTVRLLLPES
jgi:signal transduction histidine kinase